jgi:hypothetical protein
MQIINGLSFQSNYQTLSKMKLPAPTYIKPIPHNYEVSIGDEIIITSDDSILKKGITGIIKHIQHNNFGTQVYIDGMWIRHNEYKIIKKSTQQSKLNSYTVKQLKVMAKEKRIKNYSKLKKHELISILIAI